MKIGILTFWWSQDNYGQLLQWYALQKYLRDAGHDAFLIRYDSRNDFLRTPFILRCFKALNPVLLCKFLQHKINLFYFTKERILIARLFKSVQNRAVFIHA